MMAYYLKSSSLLFSYILFFAPCFISPMVEKSLLSIIYIFSSLLLHRGLALKYLKVLLLSFINFIPFLFLVQYLIHSNQVNSDLIYSEVLINASNIIINILILTSALLLIALSAWKGTFLDTANELPLPRFFRILAATLGGLNGEFRRSLYCVFQAYTSKGKAFPGRNWRNLIVFFKILGSVWSSSLIGISEKLKHHWSSDQFWLTYIPLKSSNASKIYFSKSDIVIMVTGFLSLSSVTLNFVHKLK